MAMGIKKQHYILLFAICASMFSTPLMMAGINAILPELGKSFNAGATELSLVGGLYSLGLAIFQLACGSFGDIWGHRRIFMLGGIIFALASLLAGLPNTIYTFLFLRFVQGTGGAMLSAAGLALLAASSGPEDRAAYLGLSGAAVYSGIACGPPVAGFITAAFGWQYLFYINAFTNILVLIAMHKTKGQEWRPASKENFDYPGFFLYALAIAFLTLASAQIGNYPAIAYPAIGIFLVLIIFFLHKEKNKTFPLLNISLLQKNRPLTLSCLAAFINYASFFGIIFYFSFYLQLAKGLTVQQTGLILAFQPVMQAITTPLATRMVSKLGASLTSSIGAIICGLGLLACAFLSITTPIYVLFIAQAFLGTGMAAFSLANTAFILESAGRENIGQASALTGAARTTGQLSSMLLLTFVLSIFLGNEIITPATLPEFMQSMKISLIMFGILNILGVSTLIFRNKSKV